MATFHSCSAQQLAILVTLNQIVPGDVYYNTSQNPGALMIAATDGHLVPFDNIILNGNISGEAGADGPTGPTGPQGANGTNGTNGTNGATGATGPQGPAGTGSVKQVVVKTANYSTSIADDVVLANSTTPITILITTAGLTTKITTVTNISTGIVTVQGVTGQIDGQANISLLAGESLDLLWDGSNFRIQ
jgi:hypothetical protein